MEYGAGRECAICHSPITDDNPDGIGFQCRAVYEEATTKTYFHFHGLDFWIMKVGFFLPLFVETFHEVKFRSKFKKSFFASMVERFFSGDPRISKKQLEIMKDQLSDRGESSYEDAYEVENKLRGFGEHCKSVIGNWRPGTKEELEYRNALAKAGYNKTKEEN